MDGMQGSERGRMSVQQGPTATPARPMSDGGLRKKRFVEHELSSMLRAATGGRVGGCGYEALAAGEVVRVAWRPAPHDGGEFMVDVTGRDRWAIAEGVVRAVAARMRCG